MDKVAPPKLLLVDDDPIILNTIAHGLGQAGYVVHADSDPTSALECYLQTPTDLVILDINMPGMSGTELAHKMLAAHYRPILILSSENDRQVVSDAIDSGVVGYHVKPVSAQQLIPAIETALARSAELSNQVTGLYGGNGLNLYQIETLLDQFSFGIAIVGQRHNILFSNQAADQYLNTSDNGIARHNGIFSAELASDAERCRNLIDRSLSQQNSTVQSGGLNIARSCSEQPLQLWATSLNSGDQAQTNRCATIVIVDPDQDTVAPPSILHSLYGISNKESRLAQSLLNGLSLEQHGSLHQVKPNTTRTHLKSLFQKTGTNRQAELVSLLSKLFGNFNTSKPDISYYPET